MSYNSSSIDASEAKRILDNSIDIINDMIQEQKRAIKRICKDYDFENIKELRAYFVDRFGDALDLDLWAKDENGLYNEICYYLNLK